MSDAKPTPGPWDWSITGSVMSDKYTQPYGVADHTGFNLVAGCFGDVRGGKDVAKANARLIAEAGTVYHETGLTPRQLAEQRAELLEALQIIEYNRNKGYRLTDADYSAIRRVIAKARGEG